MSDESSTPVTPVPGESEEATGVVPEVHDHETIPPIPVGGTPIMERAPFYRRPIVIVSIIVLLVLLLLVGFGLKRCGDKDSDSQLGVAGRMIEKPEDPAPAVPDGVKSFTEYKEAADILDKDKVEGNIMYDSLGTLHPERGDIRKAVASMAASEATGLTFLYTAPKNAKYINTDYSVKNGKLDYRYFDTETTNTVTAFLTWPDGTVAIKAGCANAARFYKDVPAKKISKAFKKTSKTVARVTRRRRSVKGRDTTGGAARQTIGDSNAVKTGTPGYAGNGDTVAQVQQETATSTDNNGQAGHAGAGSGSNDSGESNAGGGATDTALPGGVETPAPGDTGAPN